MRRISTRTVVTLVLVGTLVLTAGCSGIGLGDGTTGTPATTESAVTDTPTEGDVATSTASGGASTSTDDEESTDSGTDRTGSESGHDHDGHDHSHGGEGDDSGNGNDGANGSDDGSNGTAEPTEEETNESNDESSEDDGSTGGSLSDASGKMMVSVNGTELNLPSRDESGDSFGMNDSDEHEWLSGDTSLTLAEALSRLDVDATASQVTVDGETFSEQDDGTRISYRADGEEVDPETYVLEDGDEIWITVYTEEMNVSTPGTYIDNEQLHAHGQMSFSADGHDVDFSRDKYQSNHHDFHFEGGNGNLWHAHSWSITLEFALDSLADIDTSADGDTVTYNGTTYDASANGTSIDVTVNGESVEPGEYYLKDGDSVDIVIESEG